MVNQKRNFIIIGVVTLLFIVGEVVLFKVFQAKTAYIDNNALYKDFKGKADLEKDYNKEKGKEQAYLDSLYLELTVEQKKLTSSATHDMKEERAFLDKKRSFEELTNNFESRNKELQGKYLDQIWTQINQYVKEYGKDNHYDFILGATGNGTIMFANDKNDITKEVLTYINKRYDGK